MSPCDRVQRRCRPSGWAVALAILAAAVPAAAQVKNPNTAPDIDARGAISVSQRAGMILEIRKLACAVAARYVESQADGVRGDVEGASPGIQHA